MGFGDMALIILGITIFSIITVNWRNDRMMKRRFSVNPYQKR